MKIKIAYKNGSNLFVLLIASALILFAVNCKPKKDTRPFGPQYEEDPGPERGTVAERLNGIWKIEDYLLNDVSIINQSSVATSGSISIKDVHWDYIMPTKDNDWHESYLVYPWKWYALISKDTITFDGYDSTFCFWFTDPLIKSNQILDRKWQITKLYQGSLHVKLSTQRGIFKIFWKK